MRVLRLHAPYARQGGEDRSFAEEVALLRGGGVEVRTFTRANADVRRAGVGATLAALVQTPFHRALHAAVRRLCRAFRPDVAHADNLWFALSPCVHAACHDEGVPTVQSLRNYRLLCLNGLLLRDGQPCETCVGRTPWPGVRRRCYRGSALLSAAVARMIQVNRRRGTWKTDVDLFVAPSEFARGVFVRAGLEPEAIVVKPNFLADPGPPAPPGRGAVFVGRLAAEKGVDTLLEAWRRQPDVPLEVVGDGPERAALEAQARAHALRAVRFHGHLSPEGCAEVMRRAAYLVFPSACYETFGRSVMEAFALGRAVVAARGGAAAEIVEAGRTGWLFEVGDAGSLERAVARMEAEPAAVQAMGAAARRVYEARYTPARNLELLLGAYAQAQRRFAARAHGAGGRPAARPEAVGACWEGGAP
ncbi:MAG: glycosyltransferase [Planctomycetes bacterium]|nr:glycosyltransferase [Planctomycetota bacterium]